MVNPSTTTSMSLKLLIDTPGKRVVFAEAEKDLVDFLLRIPSLPVANAVGLLGNDAAFGSVANLQGSIKTLKAHILPTEANDAFLKPAEDLSFLAPPAEKPAKKNYYGRCRPRRHYSPDSDSSYSSSSSFTSYSSDYPRRDRKRRRKAAADGEGGVVKGSVSYMVTDDLNVMQLTTKSTINMMKKLGVNTLDALEERDVQLPMAEAKKFLKLCMQSKSVFTDFFLKRTITKNEMPTSEGQD